MSTENKQYKCDSTYCNREFDEKEFKLTKDPRKCILHCAKDSWYEEKENNERCWYKSKRNITYFWGKIKKELDDIYTDEYYPQNKIIYKKVIFPKFEEDKEYISVFSNDDEMGTNFYSYEIIELPNEQPSPRLNQVFTKKNIVFENCLFLDDACFKRYKFEKEVLFNNCIFEKNVDFSKITFIERFKFVECEVHKEAKFKRTKFKNLVGFEKTKFNEVSFRNTRFHNMVRFKSTKFIKDVNFEYTYFFDEAVFTDMILDSKIDLIETIFKKVPNFLDIKNIKNEKYNIKVNNRETARIIKDSFEQKNNIIDANKFYALEMKEREKELEQDKKKNKIFFEWLVFKIHGITSNHSQDWNLALFWIVIVGILTSLFNFYIMKDNEVFIHASFWTIFGTIFFTMLIFFCNSLNKWIQLGFFYLLYIYKTNDIFLFYVVKVINPFQKITDVNLIDFISKVIIAYLIYQFVVSIRQNTRRK